jgi:hypothetical protein
MPGRLLGAHVNPPPYRAAPRQWPANVRILESPQSAPGATARCGQTVIAAEGPWAQAAPRTAKCLSLSVSYMLEASGSRCWHTDCSIHAARRQTERSSGARGDPMKSKLKFRLSFDPDAWELSVVSHRPIGRRYRADAGTSSIRAGAQIPGACCFPRAASCAVRQRSAR